jgi:hypothetical protein
MPSALEFKIQKGFIPNMKRPGRQSPPPPMPKVSLSTYRRMFVCCVGREGEGAESASEQLNLKVEVLFGIV